MRFMPLCILEAVDVVLEVVLYMAEVMNGVRCVLWALRVMLCMLFCAARCAAPLLEGVEGGLCLLEVL